MISDMNAMGLVNIATQLQRIALLLEIKELKRRYSSCADMINLYKNHDTPEKAESYISACNFIENRMDEIQEILWGGDPMKLGRSATTTEDKSESKKI